MVKEIHFRTESQQCWVNLLPEIEAVITESGVAEGLCFVYNPHTTAGLFVNSYLDPNTPKDILHEWDRLIPTRFDFYHQFDTPTDASGHIKATLMGNDNTFIIQNGKLKIGFSQGILFGEFDGPRNRQVFVKIVAC